MHGLSGRVAPSSSEGAGVLCGLAIRDHCFFLWWLGGGGCFLKAADVGRTRVLSRAALKYGSLLPARLECAVPLGADAEMPFRISASGLANVGNWVLC